MAAKKKAAQRKRKRAGERSGAAALVRAGGPLLAAASKTCCFVKRAAVDFYCQTRRGKRPKSVSNDTFPAFLGVFERQFGKDGSATLCVAGLQADPTAGALVQKRVQAFVAQWRKHKANTQMKPLLKRRPNQSVPGDSWPVSALR